MKHSGFGIASFALSLISGFLILCAIGVAGYFEMQTPGGMSEDSAQAMIVGLAIILLGGAELLAFALGIVSLFQKDKKKVFGILGTILSGGIVLGTVGLIVLGLAMG